MRIRGSSASNQHKMDVIEAVFEYSDGLTASDTGPSCSSDHCPFEEAGFQACQVAEGIFNPHWHDPDDVFEILDEDDFIYASKIVRSVVGYLVDHAGVDVLIAECPADFDSDGDIDAADLAQLLGDWGPCDEPCEPGDPATTCAADLSGDCDVAAFDLAILLGAWGMCP